MSGDSVTSDRLSVLIKEVIGQCLSSGLNIVGTVCDLATENIKALNTLGSSTERPYFEINGREVVTILDPPHLLKCFRNMFLKYNIECTQDVQNDGKNIKGVAEWRHLQEFYDLDSQNPNFVFAPALSRVHLQPNTHQKMRVKFAAQIFSHTVASGMLAKISDKTLATKATSTAMLIEKMDQLFDSLNGDTPDLRRGKRFSTNVTTKRSYINKFWGDMKIFIQNMKFLNSRTPPPSQDGWVRTLNAVERLWHNLNILGVHSLSTRRLNQDPLENLFGCIRHNCGSNANPTINQFVAGLKTALLNNMIGKSTGRNCEEDNNEILDNMKRFLIINDEMKLSDSSKEESEKFVESAIPSKELSLPISLESDNSFEGSAEAQACAYVCGFIIKKQDVDCNHCKSLMIDDGASMNHIFTQFKEYSATKKSLHYASTNLVNCVELCASRINQFLTTNSHSPDIKKEILKLLENEINFDWLLACMQHYEINLNFLIDTTFQIIVRRFCVIKNREFRDEASKKALKRKMEILKNK